MLDHLISPPAIGVIAVLMLVEWWLLLRWFGRRGDRRGALISTGNTIAGVCLMGAIAGEMAGVAPRFTGLCLLGALAGHLAEVWLRLR